MHLVNACVNKAVVGFSHGDMSKYVGEGVVLYGLLTSLVGQKWVSLHHFSSFLVKTHLAVASNVPHWRRVMTL